MVLLLGHVLQGVGAERETAQLDAGPLLHDVVVVRRSDMNALCRKMQFRNRMSFKLDFRIFAHDLGEPLRVDVRLEEELDDLEGLLLHILLLSQSCSNLLTPEKEMDGVNNPGRIKLRKKLYKAYLSASVMDPGGRGLALGFPLLRAPRMKASSSALKLMTCL